MRCTLIAVWAALAAWSAWAGPAAAGRRVFSLDQCADQFVMALAPRSDIVGVSGRADDRDSWLRAQAAGLPIRRATAESVLGAHPDVVVRFWGGDARLDRAMARRRITVVRIEDASDFPGVRANVRRVAAALHQHSKGEALIARMDRQLAANAGRWSGASALYVTPSGFTAGRGSLVDAVLTAAGLRNRAPRPGYSPAPLELLALSPPQKVVAGFFDADSSALDRWAPGRHAVLAGLVRERAVATLPGAILGCPAWFAGDAVDMLGRSRP